MKSIVVVDMQNDFIDGSLGTKEAQEMLPRLKDKLKRLWKTVLPSLFSLWTPMEKTI